MGLKCQIILEKPLEGAFRPGDSVIGTVEFSLDKDSQFENITLSLKGRSRCWWKEKHRPESGSKSSFNGEENLVSIDFNLLSNPIGFVPAGTHITPFCFTLPKNLPPSFTYEGHNCRASVAYIVRTKFVYSAFFSFPARFFVDVPIINSIVPTLPQEPVVYGLHDTLSKKFGVNGNRDMDLKVTIAKSLISPGENAELCLEVYNNTKYSIPKMKICLFQILSLTDEALRTKVVSKEIEECRVKTAKVGKGKYTCLFNSVTIPSDLSTLQGSRIISRDYKLAVIASIPDMKREFTLDVPILIGRVANTNNISRQNSRDTVNLTNDATTNTCPTAPGDENDMFKQALEQSLNLNHVFDMNNSMPAHSSNDYYTRASSSSSQAESEAPPAYWKVMNEEKKPLD